MPDLPFGLPPIMPSNESQVKTYKSWFQLLGGGGLALFMSLIGIFIAYNLFKTLMEDRAEDRQELRQSDKEFREQILKATVEHTTATVRQTTLQEKTNEGLEEVKDALLDMGERIESLDRMIEKAWNNSRPQQTVTETPK